MKAVIGHLKMYKPMFFKFVFRLIVSILDFRFKFAFIKFD